MANMCPPFESHGESVKHDLVRQFFYMHGSLIISNVIERINEDFIHFA